jgi:hypothetical protein
MASLGVGFRWPRRWVGRSIYGAIAAYVHRVESPPVRSHRSLHDTSIEQSPIETETVCSYICTRPAPGQLVVSHPERAIN